MIDKRQKLLYPITGVLHSRVWEGEMLRQISRKLEALRQQLILLFDWGREDREDAALWASPYFNALSGRQIEAILGIVRGEVGRAREQYGHTIRREDALKEKEFFLLAFQGMGGILSLAKRTSFEEAQQSIYAGVEAAFREELKHYFDEWDGRGSRVWYLCHLQGVANTLLHAIWNEEITQL